MILVVGYCSAHLARDLHTGPIAARRRAVKGERAGLALIHLLNAAQGGRQRCTNAAFPKHNGRRGPGVDVDLSRQGISAASLKRHTRYPTESVGIVDCSRRCLCRPAPQWDQHISMPYPSLRAFHATSARRSGLSIKPGVMAAGRALLQRLLITFTVAALVVRQCVSFPRRAGSPRCRFQNTRVGERRPSRQGHRV